MSPADYQQIAEYEKLVREYNVRREQYDKLFDVYERSKDTGTPDPELKSFLEQEFTRIHELYPRIQELRKQLEAAQDAAFA